MDEQLAEATANWPVPRRKPSEERRASRIECDLWVRVGGVDAAARPRTGNISVTGLYVGIEEAVGSPGDVVNLSLGSIDKVRSAQTMARITRVVRQDDLHRGAAVVGAGFEFLPIDQPQGDVVELVRHITSLALGMYGGVTLDHDHAVHVSRTGAPMIAARLRSLGKDRVLISSPSRLKLGEAVRIEVTEPGGGQVHVHGRVAAADQDYAEEGERYAVVVRFAPPPGAEGEPDAYADGAVAKLTGALLAPSILPAPKTSKSRDLSGQLSRVHLPSILALAELERLEGILTVASEKAAARIYLSGGRIIDAELDNVDLAPRDVVAGLLGWTDGEFSIVCVPVRRADRFELPTTALLLDLAREIDERVA